MRAPDSGLWAQDIFNFVFLSIDQSKFRFVIFSFAKSSYILNCMWGTEVKIFGVL